MDRGWYLRFGVFVSAAVLAFLALWPSMPDSFPRAPEWVESTFRRRIALGLDIRGGLRVNYTVDVDEAVIDRRDLRAELMLERLCRQFEICGEDAPTREQLDETRERVRVASSGPQGFRVTFQDAADMSELDRDFVLSFGDLREAARTETSITLELTDESIERLRDLAVEQARETIEDRIQRMGLVEAAVTSRDVDIAVEIPGATEEQFDEIRQVIARTARLEFQICDDAATFVRDIPASQLPVGIERRTEQTSAGSERPNVAVDYLVAMNDVLELPDGDIVLGDIEEIERGSGEGRPVQRVVFHALEGPTRTYRAAEFTAVHTAREWITTFIETLDVPDDHQLAISETGVGEEDDIDTGWRTYYLFSRAELTGESVQDASVGVDQQDNQPYVNLVFNASGAREFERVTGANVRRRMAIVLDERVASAPVLQERIGGGRARITMGGFRGYNEILNDANQLVIVLRAGALPAPIQEQNSQLIGPTLGADSVAAGATGALVGISVVVVFMAVYYEVAGIIAGLLVLFNVFFLLSIMAAASGTLTLPGIAGIALTVGMAVDANVLITERIREELRLGKTARSAVENGFARAFWSIFDSQLTTFIAGVVLLQFGTGPLRGFALSLIIGIVTSLFTGVFCSKIAFDWLVRGLKVQRLRVG